MKAAVVRSFDQGPRYDSFELPAQDEGVVVDVLAAALSPRVRSGASGAHYTSKGVLPLVPGIDGVGRLANGQRVYFVGASETVGTMAEQALADTRLAVPLPDSVSSSLGGVAGAADLGAPHRRASADGVVRCCGGVRGS